jgi:hypothetical protein
MVFTAEERYCAYKMGCAFTLLLLIPRLLSLGSRAKQLFERGGLKAVDTPQRNGTSETALEKIQRHTGHLSKGNLGSE